MPKDSVFSEAFAHCLAPDFSWDDPWSAHVVLGRPLRPFSSWHKKLLEDIDSPLLEGYCPTPTELRTAVAVCRNRFRQTKVTLAPRLLDWWRLAGKGFEREVAAFNEYLQDFLQRPVYVVHRDNAPEGQTRPPVCPMPDTLRTVGTLISWTGWEDWRAWELPIGEAYHYLAVRDAEQLAGTGAQQSWLNDEERTVQARMKEEEAEADAQAREIAHRQAMMARAAQHQGGDH